MAQKRQRAAFQEGFTLIELMAVLAILAILAAIAMPAISRYSNESEFRGAVKRLAQDLQLARYHSASRPEDGVMLIESYKKKTQDRYSVQAVTPGDVTMAQLKHVTLPSYVELYGVLGQAAVPGVTYDPPDTRGKNMPTEIRFTGTGNVSSLLGTTTAADASQLNNLADRSITIFLRSADDDHLHEARVVLYMTTGYTRIYYEW